MKANLYVDGFNLYFGALKGKGPGYKWLDLVALAGRLLPKDQIHRVRYFTARVSAWPSDPGQPQRQLTYFRALGTLAPVVSIHEGHYATHPKWRHLVNPPPPPAPQKAEVFITEEKGSDVNIASFVLMDAFKNDCEAAVIVTNDSDLALPITLAQKELGLTVGVVNPHPQKFRSLQLQGTFFKQLRSSAVRACQFPNNLADAQGAFHKPPGW